MPRESPSHSYLRELFEQFDKNGDGLVDQHEFRRILAVLGDAPSEELLELEFAAMDTNSDGSVDFDEFRQWWLDYS